MSVFSSPPGVIYISMCFAGWFDHETPSFSSPPGVIYISIRTMGPYGKNAIMFSSPPGVIYISIRIIGYGHPVYDGSRPLPGSSISQ